MNRRNFLELGTAGAIAAGFSTIYAQQPPAPRKLKRKQGVTRQCFPREMSFEECCRKAAELGAIGFDLSDEPATWPTLKTYGLTNSMLRLIAPLSPPPAPGGRGAAPPGWGAVGMKEAQGLYLQKYLEGIDTAAANGFPNQILAAGGRNQNKITYEEGLDNTVAFCNLVKQRAEDKNVMICLEFLNSKGQQAPPQSLFDHMAWGVEVIKRVNSPRVKILFDIFHAQLMEGDIADTIRKNIQYIAHIHTGGVPGRHQLDETQEINYRFLAQTIASTGFEGIITHEWSPAPGIDAIEALRKSMDVMDA